jgi:hypothetical protein
MSVIHVNQIADKIKKMFMPHLDLKDLPAKDSEREIKILTRCLASYAVYHFGECTEIEAASAVIDGGDDNGIDAVYYSVQNRELLLVQSKFNQKGDGEPDSAEVGKFCNGVKDLFNSDFDRFNAKFQKKIPEIMKALTDFDVRYKLVLVDTCEKSFLAIHAKRLIDDLLDEMNSTGLPEAEKTVTFERLNQGLTYSSLASNMGQPIDLDISLFDWGKIQEPFLGYYGMVVASEIGNWWKAHERKLFNKNIRQVLGATDVNQEIEATIEKSPEKFWYYNNGITIIADDISKSMAGGGSRDVGTFKLKSASIVNGAQTVSTIGKYFQKGGGNLDKARVHVRIVSLLNTPTNFGNDVTRANNRQNKIENRDFVSQDPEQVRIKTELGMGGVEYNIVRSDLFQANDKAIDLQEATISLACASGRTSLAVQAKKGIGKIWENIDGPLYKALFNPSVDGIYVYNCVRIDRKINELLKSCIDSLPKKSGRDYGLLVHGNRLISLLTMKNGDPIKNMKDIASTIDEEYIKNTMDKSIVSMKKVLEKDYTENILGTLFKNNTKCEDIFNKCVKNYTRS